MDLPSKAPASYIKASIAYRSNYRLIQLRFRLVSVDTSNFRFHCFGGMYLDFEGYKFTSPLSVTNWPLNEVEFPGDNINRNQITSQRYSLIALVQKKGLSKLKLSSTRLKKKQQLIIGKSDLTFYFYTLSYV